LQHLEDDPGFLQGAALVDSDAIRKCLFIIVRDLVVLDRPLLGASPMLSGRGVRKMPFDKGGARHQRDVVQVDDL
jgi:hypothetical protein